MRVTKKVISHCNLLGVQLVERWFSKQMDEDTEGSALEGRPSDTASLSEYVHVSLGLALGPGFGRGGG